MMADESEEAIQLSPEAYEKMISDVSEIATGVANEVALKVVYQGIAKFLEQYAVMVETAPIKGANEAEQRIIESVLATLAADMRNVVQALQREHGSDPDILDVSVRRSQS